MQIESYIERTDNDDISSLALSGEAMALIEELNLEGQKSIQDENGNTNPYRHMTSLEMRVFKCLFPNQSELVKYDAGSIPLRVLEMAKQAQTYLTYLQVWYPKPGDQDPILVGYHADDKWHGKPFLIARWGEALESFEALKAKATTRIRSALQKELIGVELNVAKTKALLASPDIDIEDLPTTATAYPL